MIRPFPQTEAELTARDIKAPSGYGCVTDVRYPIWDFWTFQDAMDFIRTTIDRLKPSDRDLYYVNRFQQLVHGLIEDVGKREIDFSGICLDDNNTVVGMDYKGIGVVINDILFHIGDQSPRLPRFVVSIVPIENIGLGDDFDDNYRTYDLNEQSCNCDDAVSVLKWMIETQENDPYSVDGERDFLNDTLADIESGKFTFSDEFTMFHLWFLAFFIQKFEDGTFAVSAIICELLDEDMMEKYKIYRIPHKYDDMYDPEDDALSWSDMEKRPAYDIPYDREDDSPFSWNEDDSEEDET